jgi:hypothetical protein
MSIRTRDYILSDWRCFLKWEDVSQSSLISDSGLKWEMTEKRPLVWKKHLWLFHRYDSMFIKDLVMWRHYNVIFENSDITKRPWQRLAISDNLNLLSVYVIWNILVLNIKRKGNKIAINIYTSGYSDFLHQ